MPRALGDTFRPAVEALRVAVGEPAMRRLMLAWLAVNAGKWAFLVTTLVTAYESGGAVAVSILGLARFLTPSIVAPFAGLPTVRWPPEVVLRTVNAIRAVAVALAVGVIVGGLPIEILYLVVAVEAGFGAFSRPLHMGLMPAISTTPAQLVAANVTSSAAEGLGTFAGPAVASVLLAVTGPAGSTLAVLAIYALGVAAIATLHVPAVGRSDTSGRAVVNQISAGVRAVATMRGPRLVILGLSAQTFVRGLLTVLIVVTAIELLGMGEPGVGTLNAGLGLGGIVGAAVAISLAARARLAPSFAVSLAAWGAPIAVIGIVVHPGVAIMAMIAIGVANSVIDVSGFTLVQRLTPNRARIAVLGLIDTVANAGVALGGLAAPPLIDALGIEGALIVTGLILPAAAIASWPWLRRIDDDAVVDAQRVDLLRGDPLFGTLSLATIEHLAACLRPVAFDAEAVMIREGDDGRDYFILATGAADVEQGGRHVRRIGPGMGVGEIALLRDVPRTATVRAVEPIEAFALDRDAFLEAITGHAVTRTTATERVDRQLAADRTGTDLH